jgi:hypothetical protein
VNGGMQHGERKVVHAYDWLAVDEQVCERWVALLVFVLNACECVDRFVFCVCAWFVCLFVCLFVCFLFFVFFVCVCVSFMHVRVCI